MELSIQDKAAQDSAKYISQLADVLIERYRNDIVYTKAGNVLISINPNRVIPMVFTSASSSSSSSVVHNNPKSPNLRSSKISKDANSKGNRSSYAASPNARGINSKSSSSSSVPSTSYVSSSSSSEAVPLFHQSLMWNYYEYTKRTPAIPGLAPSPHIFGVAANALHTACYANTNIALLCTGEPGSGKSETVRQIVRFLTTVSRAARVRQQQTIHELQARGSRLPVSLAFPSHPSVQAYMLTPGGKPPSPSTIQPPRSFPSHGPSFYASSSKNTSPSSTASANSSSVYPSSAPSIEQLLVDAHTILDAFGSAGENNGNSRSPMSSRYIRWTRIKVNPDGSIVQAQVKTSLYDPWRIVCPPPGTHDYSKTGSSSSGTIGTTVDPPTIPAATRYVLGIHDSLSSTTSKNKPVDSTKTISANNHKVPFTVDTNYRIFYQLLAGVNEEERSNYRLLDNPIDYSYLAAYGSITCPFVCEPLLERERLRRSKAFSGAAKAYAGSVVDPDDDDNDSNVPSSAASVYSTIRYDTTLPASTASSLSAANVNTPAMLNPTLLSNEFSILKAALTRFQLNSNAQGAIFRIISVIILLGNLQFDVKEVPIVSATQTEDESMLRPTQSTTYVSNGEVLWSCASLLGVKMDALAHALTHVAINPSSAHKGSANANPNTPLYPTFVTLSPAKASLVRDSLAITLYRRLWNHLLTHINAVLTDIGREAAITHNEAAKTFGNLLPPEMRPRPDMDIAASIEIVDNAGLGNVYGDGLLRTTARAEAEAASLLASHSRFNPTTTTPSTVPNSVILGGGMSTTLRRNTHFPGPASFANLLRNYASETIDQIYYDSVIGCPIAAYEKEGIPHAYLSALLRGNAPANTVSSPSNSSNSKGSNLPSSTPLSASQLAWMQVFGTSLPPPPTLQSSSSSSTAHSRRDSSHSVSSPSPVLDAIPFLPPPDNTSLLALFDASAAQGGIWSSLGEATRYAYHDPSYGLAAHSTGTATTKDNSTVTHTHDAQQDTFSSLPPSWRGNVRAEGAWIDTTLSRLRRAPGTPSCVRRPTPGETEQILKQITPYTVPSSSSIDKYLTNHNDTSDTTTNPSARHNSTVSSTMMVVRHSNGEVAYMMEGIFACNSCACCESALNNPLPNASLPSCGLPKHIQTVLSQLSSDTLVRILMTDTPLDNSNLPKTGSDTNATNPDMHSFGSHTCSTTTDCLRWFLQELHSTLSVSSLQWIRCIRPTDDVYGVPSSNHIAHDTIARQVRSAGILQICLISAFGHPVSIPMTEFYERYITLDVNTLRRYGPFFPRGETPLPVKISNNSLSSRLNSILSPSMRIRVESMLGMIENEQDPTGALLTTMEGRVAASNLADALWARLYLPQASKLKAITFALPPLHPNASLELLMTKLFNPTPSRPHPSSDGEESDIKPFRFMDSNDSNMIVPSNSTTTRDQIVSSDGTSLATTVAVGNRHVFMSHQYAECIEAARSRAAIGMDAAARRIQACIRSFLAQLHYKGYRSAVIRLQASFRTRRHVRAYQYFREKGFKVKAALLTHTARKRYLRILQAVAKWKSVWRRARTRRILHEKALALRAFHTLARGFVIRSAVYKWHAAAIRVQLPIRKFLQQRKYQRATEKVVVFGQKHWRGKLSRRKHWMETARLKALRQVHIRARFIRRLLAYTQGKRIRQQFLYLRRTAIRLQRWIRGIMVRRAWKRVVRAVLRIQAAIRGAADRRMVANMRSAAAAAVEACHMQALRLAEARMLGVFDSLRSTLESMIISAEEEEAEMQASGEEYKYKTKRKSKSRSSSISGYTDGTNDDYVETGKEIFGSVVTGRFPQGQRDISASVAMRLRAPVNTASSAPNSSGNFGVSLRLLDVDVRGQLRDVYYGGDINDDDDDETQTELTYASTAVARAEREDVVQYKAKLKDSVTNEDKKDDEDNFPLEELSEEIDRLYIRLRALDRWANLSVTSASVRVPDLSWASAFRSVAVSLASRDKQISSLAIGDTHTVTLGTDGCVYTWGWSDEGQCGHGNTLPTSSPKLVTALADPTHAAFPHASRNLTAVGLPNPSVGNTNGAGTNSSVRDKNSKANTNGSFVSGSASSTAISRTIPTAAPITIIAVAAGREHTLALSNLGIVYAWGGNSRGQCGLGHTDSIAYPCMVPGFQKKILSIAAGDRHSAFLTQSGSVFTCGSGPCCGHGTVNTGLSPSKASSSVTVATLTNSADKKKDILRKINDRRLASQQLNVPPPVDVLTPLPVRSLSYLTLAGLATGRGHTVVVATTGEAFAWGANEVGQCGIGKQYGLPYVAVPTQINATPASAQASYLLPEMNNSKKEGLLTMDKTGKLIVSPNRTQDGKNPSISTVSRADTTVTLSNENSSANNQKPFRFVRIACGACHTLLLSAGGRILSFGRNRHGQLGTGDRIDRYEPTSVRLPLPLIHNGNTAKATSNSKAYIVLDIAAAGDSSYALATTTSPRSGVTPSPTLRGTPAHLPVTLATDAVRRRMFQWGHTGSVTEARMRMLPSSSFSSSASLGNTESNTNNNSVINLRSATRNDALPLVPIGIDSLDLLVPTPIRSLASHTDPTYSTTANNPPTSAVSINSVGRSDNTGRGDTFFDTTSVTGSQVQPLDGTTSTGNGNINSITSITAPVGVFAVGHTTLSIAWVQAHTLPRLNPLVRNTGGSWMSSGKKK